MFKSGRYILFPLILWNLCVLVEVSDHHSRDFCPTVLEKLDRMERQMEEAQSKIHNHLETIQEALTTKKTSPEIKQEVEEKPIPANFERIGARYFYVESHVKKDWNSSASSCLQMGGNLAVFQHEWEFDAIQAKLKKNHYWLGINDRAKSNQFVSAASGNRVSFFKWGFGQPVYNYDKSESYVFMYDGQMGLWRDDYEFYFVCQADDL